jgi:hypothetical protein
MALFCFGESMTAGFDFQRLNQKYLAQPANDAVDYGASIVPANSINAWRCIGIHHLTPDENRGRQNVFIDVLDESGNRLRQPIINWTFSFGGPVQQKRLDKPANEPAADIPIDKDATITLWVADSLDSDRVGELYTRHRDESPGNMWGHHSFYVVFQRQKAMMPINPPIDPPIDPLGGDEVLARLTKLEEDLFRLKTLLAQWTGE